MKAVGAVGNVPYKKAKSVIAHLSSTMGLAENLPTIMRIINGNTMALAKTNTDDRIKSEELFKNKLNFPAMDKPIKNSEGAAKEAAKAYITLVANNGNLGP